MKSLWAQFSAQLRRDLAEWWPLWAAAVFAGLVPVLLPVIYSTSAESAMDLRVAAMVLSGGLYGLASLALLGDGLASRDLAEGRLTFFVARPLSTGAFWLARVAAALFLTAAIAFSLALPTWIAESGRTSREPAMDPWTMSITAPGMELARERGPFYVGEGTLGSLELLAPVGVLGALLSLLLLAHLAGTAARSRDAWTLLDFGGLLIVAVLVLAIRDVLLSAHAFGALVAAERVFAAAMATALFVAGLRQLEHGRVDPMRGHGVFSRTAWPLLVLASLALLGAARWVASPSPDDLRSADFVATTSGGESVLVTGRAAHRFGLHTGVIFREGGGSTVVGPVSSVAPSTRDGGFAWVQCTRLYNPDCEVWRWSPEAEQPRATGIFSNYWDQQLALSPPPDPRDQSSRSNQHERLALSHDKLEVWELSSSPGGENSRLVYALDRAETYPIWPGFLSTTRLRFLAVDPEGQSTPLREVDLSSRSVRTLGELPGEAPIHLVTSPSGRFVFTVSLMPSRLAVLDTETAAVYELQDEPLFSGNSHVSPTFTDDRTLFLLAATGDGPRRLARVDLSTWMADGLEEGLEKSRTPEVSEVPVPPLRARTRARLGVRKGKLLLSGEPDADLRASLGTGGLALPEGVEPLPNHALWRLDESGWQLLAAGVESLQELPSAAPQADTATLVAAGGAVLRLDDDALRLVVPALPNTASGRPAPF